MKYLCCGLCRTQITTRRVRWSKGELFVFEEKFSVIPGNDPGKLSERVCDVDGHWGGGGLTNF